MLCGLEPTAYSECCWLEKKGCEWLPVCSLQALLRFPGASKLIALRPLKRRLLKDGSNNFLSWNLLGQLCPHNPPFRSLHCFLLAAKRYYVQYNNYVCSFPVA